MRVLWSNFLGGAPTWYKQLICAFLLFNPVSLVLFGPYFTGWCLLLQFITTLALALRCYPLQPGGLLVLEALLLGLTDTASVYHETVENFNVILLLMFMVAGIYFMKDMLLFIFLRVFILIRSKILLSLLFCFVAAFLSAFLDALTVTAVLINMGIAFYSVYSHAVKQEIAYANDLEAEAELQRFRAFLRSLIMHGIVGTALGGVCTLVGEPQNLLIAERVGWDFLVFIERMAPVTMPALAAGLLLCMLLEWRGWCGYGTRLTPHMRSVLEQHAKRLQLEMDSAQQKRLLVQALVFIVLALSLALHLAEVGLIGLMVIILLTAFNGVIEEREIGPAFEEALPFTSLLVVFFAVVAVINQQQLFAPVSEFALSFRTELQPAAFFLVNALLSIVSDNVFVATVYINEASLMLQQGSIEREQFERLAVAINTGTNLPSVATPNGQAAFLFLLTSPLAPMLYLGYGRMVYMALPYAVLLSGVGVASIFWFI